MSEYIDKKLYKHKSIYESNCVEFFKPINNEIVEDIQEDRYFVSNQGRIFDKKLNKFLNPIKNGRDEDHLYSQVNLKLNSKKQVTRKIHRIEMIAFEPLPSEDMYKYMQVNHKDGNQSNNILSNLEWNTASDNRQHAIINDLERNCFNCKITILNDEELANMKDMINNRLSYSKIASILNINRKTISNIVRGKSKLYSDKYNNI